MKKKTTKATQTLLRSTRELASTVRKTQIASGELESEIKKTEHDIDRAKRTAKTRPA